MPYVERADARIWWDSDGSGEPVLLIMGLGYPSEMWYRLLPALTEAHRAIWFDNRGVGRTGEPPGPYLMDTMAEDAAAVLDAAGEDSAHVVGVSMGGVIAQELALRYPQRVRSLVLACTHPGGAEAAPLDDAVVQMLTARADMTPEEGARLAVPFIYSQTTPCERIEEDIATRMANPTSPQGYANQLQGVVAHTGTHARLGSVSVPTLILHGSADRLVSPENARILAAAIPGARLELIDGASHIFFTDAPERSAQLLGDFLAEVGSAPRPR